MKTSSSSSSFRIRKSIILFGDSITQQAFGCHPDTQLGWASLLAADYARRADVLNRGFSGYTSRHAVDLLPRVFTGPTVEPCLFCTVFFGANDAALPGELQHVPVDEYGQNLQTIVQHLQSTLKNNNDTFPIILLLTPPPFDAQAWMSCKEMDTPGRDNRVAKQYGDKVKEVAAGFPQCSVVDTWTLLQGNAPETMGQYLSDGLHLNEEGNRMVHKGIMDVLARDYPQVLPMLDGDSSGVPLEEPLWRELFPEN